MAVKNYDPKLITLICGPKIISGYIDGTFVVAERNEQAFNLKVGVDGEGCRARSRNRSGKITFTLLQSSTSNDDLSDFAVLDEATGGGTFPFLGKDADGTTLLQATTAWVQKFANVEYGKEPAGRVWVIETDELLMFVGGNDVAA
jgi:hypothetical protein